MRGALVALAVMLGACAQAPVAAQQTAVRDGADLSGLWVISNRSVRGNLDEEFKPLRDEQYLNAAGLAAVREVKPALDPSAQCLPSIPRHLTGPYPIEIVQRPGRVVQLFEWDTVFRIIYTDGRERPEQDEDQRFMGFALGTWEGATLKVETANFNGKAWMEGRGVPMSEEARLTEWYSLTEGGRTLQMIGKYEDPKYLSRPVWRKAFYNRKEDWGISEYFCAEGNRDNVFQQREGQPGALTEGDVIRSGR